MDLAVEILIRLLNEAKIRKIYLNEVCEESWKVVSPQGIEKHGVFLQNNVTKKQNDEKDGIVQTSCLESVCKDVNELINYAQCVRSSQTKGKITSTKNKNVATQEPSQDNNVKTLKNSLGNNITLHHRVGAEKKRLKGQCSVMSMQMNQGRNEDVPQNPSHFGLERYSHLCSYTLNDKLKSLKITPDHLHILRLYHCYESIKNESLKGNNSIMLNFRDGCVMQANIKLKIHLEANIKQKDKYLKYIDLSSTKSGNCMPKHCSNLNTIGFSSTRLLYSSIQQLKLFESKYQHLLELQQQSDILDMVMKEI